MNSLAMSGLVTDFAGVRQSVGWNVGHTDWAEMTQDEVKGSERPAVVAESAIRFYA